MRGISSVFEAPSCLPSSLSYATSIRGNGRAAGEDIMTEAKPWAALNASARRAKAFAEEVARHDPASSSLMKQNFFADLADAWPRALGGLGVSASARETAAKRPSAGAACHRRR